MKKFFNTLGFRFNKVEVGTNLTMADLGNPLFTLNGSWLVNLLTATVNSFRFRDNTKGTDIITINTSTDVIELKYHTILTNLVTQITFANSPYTATWGQDLEVDCTGGVVVVNLPTAVGNNGKTISITKVDASVNAITVDGSTTETINGSLTRLNNSQWETVILKSNGTNVTTR